MTVWIKQSTTQHALRFFLVQSSDHITGLTGATPTVKISKAGSTGAAPSGAVTEIDSTNLPGWYKIAANATDTNTLGSIDIHATATSADPCDVMDAAFVVPFDPTDTVRMGLTALQSTAASVDGNGLLKVDIEDWKGSAVNALVQGKVDASLVLRTGTAQAGAAGTITLDAGASATDNLYNGCLVWIVGGTGAGQARAIASYVGATKVVTVDHNWITNPDATSIFIVVPADWAALNSSLQPVASAATSVTNPVTVGTNNDKTAYTLSAAGIQAIYDYQTSLLTTAGSFGLRMVSFITGDTFGRLGAPAGASVSADIAALKADLDAGVTVAAAGFNNVLDAASTVEGFTWRQWMRAVFCMLPMTKRSGLTNDGSAGTAHIRDVADTKDRVVIGHDGHGNIATTPTFNLT